MPEVDDVENEQMNVLETVFNHQVDEHIEDDILCKPNVDHIVVERLVARHVTNNFIDDGTMSSFLSDALFLEFSDELNTTRGSSSVGDSLETTQSSSTPRRHQKSRLLELERYVHANGRILQQRSQYLYTLFGSVRPLTCV
ncbi:CACTA en-spm transposon protein [Cucumis melo var. makuwa]|uniref:CACTA en-spm transposon protein n=1 Tax=Cucumis melo var. makuwa TaxID=1194695 RepID=A0A5A7T372_CUCMM|nr:CACTA en-spm transposon protein [Cucumis melo var. makuwa]TYJ97501.1 CACTA en-spm transposon protein [Cucumis melo var. makuwa]